MRRGLYAYVAGLPGFYVVNPKTSIAVSRWDDQEDAERDAAERNAIPPPAPDPLIVHKLPFDEGSNDGPEERLG